MPQTVQLQGRKNDAGKEIAWRIDATKATPEGADKPLKYEVLPSQVTVRQYGTYEDLVNHAGPDYQDWAVRMANQQEREKGKEEVERQVGALESLSGAPTSFDVTSINIFKRPESSGKPTAESVKAEVKNLTDTLRNQGKSAEEILAALMAELGK